MLIDKQNKGMSVHTVLAQRNRIVVSACVQNKCEQK